MIPIQLLIKNFLSYRDAALDFSGLHTACICGANGAGKSSLLEAITWVIWGQSRATVEDDIIHAGAKEVRVDFTFQTNEQVYRIIRNRVRGGTSIVEFQIETPSGFRPLTGKGLKATQDVILQHIKLDYDTFINSAYLRQGKADEFMLKRPGERKEILAELLKLNQYDELEEKAKDTAKLYKGRVEELERSLESITLQLSQKEMTESQKTDLELQLNNLQQTQALDNIQLQSLQVIAHERQNWEQQLGFTRQQEQNLIQDSDRLQKDQLAVKSQLGELEKILHQEREINVGYAEYQNLQSQEELFTNKFEQHTRATNLKEQKQRFLDKQIQDLERKLQQIEAELLALEKQEEEIKETLTKTGNIESALLQLNAAREHLAKLDELQMQVTPLLQQRTSLQSQIDRAYANLVARLDQIQVKENELQNQYYRQPQLQQALMEVGMQIAELDKKKVYLQRVKDKGQERKSFIERLQSQQREYEKILEELENKLQMLHNPNAPCPLCERPLNEHYWSRVVGKTQTDYDDIQGQFWVVREQIAVSDREIQVLRQEYKEILQNLSGYDALLEQRGQLSAQLDATSYVKKELEKVASEREHLENSLQAGDYLPDKQREIAELDAYLQQLNYNPQDHALARNEVDRWRWVEIKQGQIKDAIKRQGQLAAKKPELIANIQECKLQIQALKINSILAVEIEDLTKEIAEIGYSVEQHNYLRQNVRKSQSWELKHQNLLAAKSQYPELETKYQELKEAILTRGDNLKNVQQQINNLVHKLSDSANPKQEIEKLQLQIDKRRRELDEKIAQLGRLEQMTHQLESLQKQYDQEKEQLENCKKQQRVYQELALAFGKNGIQALMIENVLPQLEAEANSLLSRLSANQFHVQFVTQKSGRSGKSTRKNAKLIDTLDILIADARGTRSYETYSGGESFRINFAIRLALAKLLAQRAGSALQLLVVDEGFGTQDGEGCDRLIAAINAISADFACILTVTHIPHLKEAFQARIEVSKNQQGSQLQLLT
ncbi:exonuclease subunit SbcC [Anabaena sp. FACHB-1237]|uniref:exonuclease subunit SbcC n=1 Tax=Anabaena sp. FACHB-1237 TaxID=2692769 RepID=UPI00168051ED|nr:exonuclease subunit SbcC [Anabaena sp. FACHB-1237]MBD2137151.1 exonuclease subunit SbcC [Anabaena sp. FACHB-1237]